ncbi:hypothetical protein GPECTOR_16g672 [Gonium pectorale]|uniref:RNA helicase n=1 Tax=Gonium pectorale TaxID=33097 RepID=A0A150GL36_GONPE|nr:hypothetical protein GPECTOR_16g672 [Gonium pectorale]|eukprot:KXZ50497.1 hypothetical protein GPECTOR_16g672 [Gonium pectorale]
MDSGTGGFLRPGVKSGSAFGVQFDRPPAARGSKHRADGRAAAASASAPDAGTKRSRHAAHGPDGPGTAPGRTGHGAGDSDSDSDPGPSGRPFPEGVPRGPDLPPMNPSYRYGDPSLPVSRHRRQILYLVERHAVTLIVGETGSGKSTQVPQFLYEAGWAAGGYAIAVTQPRRVAAASVAARVAEEMGVDLGTTVGYAVRFDSAVTQGRTRIKYLTDGVLLREMMDDPLLTSYSVVMVDEAHERSLATDMLLGLLKKVLRRRPDLRLIISSATLEAERLRQFFDTTAITAAATATTTAWAPGSDPDRSPAVLTVEGRTHPVQVHYLEAPAPDYVTAAVEAAVDIHCEDVPGDVLIFLTGQEEVQSAVSLLEENARRLASSRGYSTKMLPLPLYAGLHGSQQSAVFRPTPRGYRKVVVATNVAETSITLEGVVYVIDCCFVKLRAFDPLTGLEALHVAPLSAAGAAQRAGRAGRLRAGHCFRLCTEEDFAKLMPPLKALGVDNVMRFDWLAPPPAEAMVRALEDLHALRVLDDDARLTRDVGMALAALPLDPPVGAALLASRRLGCVEEMLTLAALMAGGGGHTVWVAAPGSSRALEAAQAKFAAAEGDAVTLLNVHRAWRAHGRSGAWAQRHCLHQSALLRADDARDQLLGCMRRLGLLPHDSPPPSCGREVEPICRALAAGLFLNAAVLEGTEYDPLAPEGDPGTARYRLVRYTQHKTAPCVVFANAQQQAGAAAGRGGASGSGGAWFEMQGVTAVRPEWLHELAPHMFARRGRTGEPPAED